LRLQRNNFVPLQAEGGKVKKVLISFLFFACSSLYAQQTKVTPLMMKPLPDFRGKEVFVITVDYPPGGSDPIHKHNAHAFVYVLEGSIVMGVKGGNPVTLHPGQTWYEGPNDIHTIGRNASKTKPAKFLVLLLKARNTPVFIPVK
jgi:quercetin dioxygenase-like cupin family protein